MGGPNERFELVENIDQEAKVNEESENWWKLGMGANQSDAEEEWREGKKGGGGASGRKAGWGSGEKGHSEGVAGLEKALQFSVVEGI